jgi:hypothetical protein
MVSNTVHLYFDGKHWRVRSQDARVPPRVPFDTYFAADSAAHDLSQRLSADERHHDRGEVLEEKCDPESRQCSFEKRGYDAGAAKSADKRYWLQTLDEIERMMQPRSEQKSVPDEPGEPDREAPVSAEIARELQIALEGSPRASDLLVRFWQTAEQDGLDEALDRLSVALEGTGRDLSRVKLLIEQHHHPT